MDILLFNPYYSQMIEYYSYYRPTAPLGLMYLSSYLQKNGLDSSIIELGIFNPREAVKIGKRIRFGLSDELISDVINKNNPKIIGITCMYSIYYRDVIEIANTIKRINPEIKVVIGGNHASSYWKSMLVNKNIDFVVVGEGEETFLELVNNILNKKDISGIKGIAYNRNNKIEKTTPRQLIKNLDEIPFPAFDKIDMGRYINEPNTFAMRSPGAGIISSRGCPGNCVYCTIKAVWGRAWRGRTAKNVVDEIEFLINKYKIKEFYFLDDSASVDRKRWEGICDEIIKRELNIKWTTPNGIAHWTLTKGTLDKMRRSGCYRITFGIESGNTETRRFLGKPYSLNQAKEIIKYANKIGMWTICTNILGFPYEDLNSINDTINFAKKCSTDFACFYLLIPQPTSDVYNYFRKEGLLNLDNYFESGEGNEEEFAKVNYILNETGCDTIYFNKEKLNYLQRQAYRTFMIYRAFTYLSNPLIIIRKIHSLEDFRYILHLLLKGFEIFYRTLNPLNKKSSDFIYAESKVSVNN